METAKEILTVQECAKFLGVSVQTIHLKTSRNELPYYKPSRRIYFLKDEIIKWIMSHPIKTSEQIEEEAKAYNKALKKSKV
jgi:excisionase family DNA binding protein